MSVFIVTKIKGTYISGKAIKWYLCYHSVCIAYFILLVKMQNFYFPLCRSPALQMDGEWWHSPSRSCMPVPIRLGVCAPRFPHLARTSHRLRHERGRWPGSREPLTCHRTWACWAVAGLFQSLQRSLQLSPLAFWEEQRQLWLRSACVSHCKCFKWISIFWCTQATCVFSQGWKYSKQCLWSRVCACAHACIKVIGKSAVEKWSHLGSAWPPRVPHSPDSPLTTVSHMLRWKVQEMFYSSRSL